MTAADVAARCQKTRQQGDGWVACCPAHDDRTPSLSINSGDDGRVLLCCHAGCDTDGIVQGLGLTMRDLMPAPLSVPRSARETVEERYDYTAEDGCVLFQVERLRDPKRFRQRRPDGAGGWTWQLRDVRRVLFGLPKLQGQKVAYVTEGEKDALALRKLRLVATTNAGGAGKWREDYTHQLTTAGVRSVAILPDNDEPGRAHAEAVARSCSAAGLAVKVVELPGLPQKGDISDWLAAGHSRDELIARVKATALYEPNSMAAQPAAANTTGKTHAAKTDTPKQGRAVQLEDPEPWPDSVDGAALLDALRAEADREPPVSSEAPSLLAADTSPKPATVDGDDRPRKSQATRLVDLALGAGVELWHSPAGDPYVTLPADGHREHHRLNAGAVRDWLARRHYAKTHGAPGSQAIADALAVLSGRARYDGAEHETAVRVAGGPDAVYLDLGDPSWRAVQITPDGWRVITDPPVRFIRSRGMLALSEPTRGGSIADLRALVHVASDGDYRLIIGWLLGALRPTGPYPLLSLVGEQGGGKSTVARLVRRLIDPHVAELRAEPRTIDDVMIAASRSRVVALDNLSHLAPWLSDALCRVATGGALTKRELYSNDDETIIEAVRPTIVTSIADVVARGICSTARSSCSSPCCPRPIGCPRLRCGGASTPSGLVSSARCSMVSCRHWPASARP